MKPFIEHLKKSDLVTSAGPKTAARWEDYYESCFHELFVNTKIENRRDGDLKRAIYPETFSLEAASMKFS